MGFVVENFFAFKVLSKIVTTTYNILSDLSPILVHGKGAGTSKFRDSKTRILFCGTFDTT